MKATKFKAQLVKFATSPLIAPVVFLGVEVKSKTDKDVLIAIKATLAKLATPISEEPAEDERFCLTAGDQPKMASVAKPEEDLGPEPDELDEKRTKRSPKGKSQAVLLGNLGKVLLRTKPGFHLRRVPRKDLVGNQDSFYVMWEGAYKNPSRAVGKVLVTCMANDEVRLGVQHIESARDASTKIKVTRISSKKKLSLKFPLGIEQALQRACDEIIRGYFKSRQPQQ